VDGGWLLIERYLNHRHEGREVFGFFRTLLLDPKDVELAHRLAQEQPYPGNDFFPSLPEVRDVLAAEMPWSRRFQPGSGKQSPDSFPRPTLGRDWQDDSAGVRVGQVAVDFAPELPRASETGLSGAYAVPSAEFAARFSLRQLPGNLDLIGLDGRRASAVFGVGKPWRGHLLFMRRHLVEDYAGDRRIMQVAWGEREVGIDWHSRPDWMNAAHQNYTHIWRRIRLLGDTDTGGTGT
jgi:hypothetical protein